MTEQKPPVLRNLRTVEAEVDWLARWIYGVLGCAQCCTLTGCDYQPGSDECRARIKAYVAKEVRKANGK